MVARWSDLGSWTISCCAGPCSTPGWDSVSRAVPDATLADATLSYSVDMDMCQANMGSCLLLC